MSRPYRPPMPPRGSAHARPARVGTFTDRVMAQVSLEPTPMPARVFGHSLLALRPGAAVATLATAWHLAFGRTRAIPSLVRIQSLTLLLVLAVVVGTGGTLATAGALRMIDGPADPTAPPLPVIVIGSSPMPSSAPSASPSASPTPAVEIAQEGGRRTEEAAPTPRKRNQAQEGGTDSGDRKRSRDAGEQQKKQPARDSSGTRKQEQPHDDSDRSAPSVKESAKTPKPAGHDGDKSGHDQTEKSGPGS